MQNSFESFNITQHNSTYFKGSYFRQHSISSFAKYRENKLVVCKLRKQAS